MAFSTYQVGKVFVIGINARGALSVTERTFPRCMGLCADGEDLWLSSLSQVWRLSNILPPGQSRDGYDRLYVPQEASTTGDIDIHDMAVDADGRLLFISAAFCCLATLNPRRSFTALWTPPFISRLAREDRCHLNGLALEDGRPRYATAVATTDTGGAWRDHKRDGGVVLEILAERRVSARCGLSVIDLRSGDHVEWLELGGIIEDLYDVAALPGCRRPTLLGLKGDAIQRTLSFEVGTI